MDGSGKMSDKVLWKNDWIEVRERDNWYTFTTSPSGNSNGVAVLGFKREVGETQYLGRYELTVCHSPEIELASLTGMCDKEGENVKTTAMRELEEESGYVVNDLRRFIELGTVRPSKSSDYTITLFAIEIKDTDEKVEIAGDGTKGEEGAYCKWISREEAVNCKDPLVSTMIARLDLKL